MGHSAAKTLLLFALAGCAHVVPVARDSPPLDGYAMVMNAAACWMGPPWFEAQGAAEAERKPRTLEACRSLERAVWGESGHTRLEQLRAFESEAVTDFVTAVGHHAAREDSSALQTLAQALADAQREAMWARRGADRVRLDLDYETERLTTDEQAVARSLQRASSLRALFDARVGRFTGDARLLAVMTAADRMQLARALPKRMKLFALADVYAVTLGTIDFFSLQRPDEPALPGQWLTLLTDAAKAAGHEVPSDVKDPKVRDAAAWAGVLAGFADRLEGQASRSPELALVVAGTARRLRAEATGDQHYVSSRAH